jgi:hypothetical protein
MLGFLLRPFGPFTRQIVQGYLPQLLTDQRAHSNMSGPRNLGKKSLSVYRK